MYTPLEVDKVMNFAAGTFNCEDCGAELEENEDAESVQGSKDRMMRFNHQMRFIREGLQRSEAMTLPPFDVAAWVKINAAAELESQRQKLMSSGSYEPGAGLKVAGADSNGKREEGIGILMVHEAEGEDIEKQRRERAKESELKRIQNALPAWHLKSTITGDLTALGVKESARAAANAAMNGGGDDSLRGLGVAGNTNKHTPTSSVSTYVPGLPKFEDTTSATLSHDADMIEQYYANLAAASNPAGINSTPVSTSATPSATLPSELDEEEDRKPSMKYLESLTEYRKRSRSSDDVGTGGPKTPKIAKTDSNTSLKGLLNGSGSGGFANGGSNGHLPDAFPPESTHGTPAEPPQSQAPAMDEPEVMGRFLV